MIVQHLVAVVGEIVPHSQRISGGENSARQLDRRIRRERDREIAVAHHVPENAAAILILAVRVFQLLREITAAIKPVGGAEAIVGFFAIEEDQLDLPGPARMQAENARQLEQGARARAAVVRSEESRVGKECRTRWAPY